MGISQKNIIKHTLSLPLSRLIQNGKKNLNFAFLLSRTRLHNNHYHAPPPPTPLLVAGPLRWSPLLPPPSTVATAGWVRGYIYIYKKKIHLLTTAITTYWPATAVALSRCLRFFHRRPAAPSPPLAASPLLNRYYTKIVLPKAQGRMNVRKIDAVIIYFLYEKIKLSLSGLMLAHMVSIVERSNHSLPYGA